MRNPSPMFRLARAALALAASLASLQALCATPAVNAAASPAPVPTAAAPSASSTMSSGSTSGAGNSGSASSSSATATNGASLSNGLSGRVSNADAIGPTADPAPFAPGSTFSNDNGNPELGLSPGQTSSGTLAGVEPSGLDVGNTIANNPTSRTISPANALTAGTTGILPADVGAVGGGFYGGGGTAVGGTAVAISPGRAPGSATPLLDQVTRNAQARIERRRATGTTAQVIGIAPRTDVDRTDQMPDDPIIRY